MEISTKYIRSGLLALLFGFLCGNVLYSCSQQRSLATSKSVYKVVYQDTFIVPKHLRPSTIAKQAPTLPLKMPTEEQKDFNKKLNYVLNNAGTSFENISLIRGDLSELKKIILERAIVLRNSNDSLRNAIMSIRDEQVNALAYAHQVEDARRKDASMSRKDRELNQAYRDAITTYSTAGITVFILLLFAVGVLVIMVYTQKKYLKTHFNHAV